VFYVPLRNEYGDNNSLNINTDATDLTKRFDEDLSNKHLIVTFRDIGYSLFLDSVESIPDENDQSKIRVSGKMIVDGICIQFFGCFDYGNKTKKHSDTQTQQINGVGRIELDEKYYRELSSTQISSRSIIKEENKNDKEKLPIEPIIVRRTRHQTTKVKERSETMTIINKPKTRSRTISENILPQNRTSVSTSPPSPPPPPPPLQITIPVSHSSISTTRPRIHSPSHMPYPLRSPRTKQHRTSSPVHFTSSSTLRNSEVHSSFMPTPPTAFTEYSQTSSTTTTTSSPPPSIESSHSHRIHVLTHSPHFSSPIAGQTTMPIQIPSSSNTGVPTTSLPHLTNLFPLTQSHSLPTYFLPTANIAYITTATPTTNPSGTPFDITSLTGNTSVLLITSPTQHPSQPVHILTPIDHRSLQFTHYTPTNLFVPPPILPPSQTPSTRICNILQSTSTSESMSFLQHKRHENEEDKQSQRSLETNKQSTEQLPFKKRRYTGQQSRMATVHNDDDDVSDESVKK
ncbi:unnamed protein product, partial [Rotaria sp. Silwood1]